MTPSPYWRRSFARHDPLTIRFARTISELEADPYAFFEGPQKVTRRRPSKLAEPARWVLSMILLCLMFTAPRWWPVLFGG